MRSVFATTVAMYASGAHMSTQASFFTVSGMRATKAQVRAVKAMIAKFMPEHTGAITTWSSRAM
jgi:hypothetical protein